MSQLTPSSISVAPKIWTMMKENTMQKNRNPIRPTAAMYALSKNEENMSVIAPKTMVSKSQ